MSSRRRHSAVPHRKVSNITQATRVYVQCWRKENKGEETGCDINLNKFAVFIEYLINRTHIIWSLDQPCY